MASVRQDNKQTFLFAFLFFFADFDCGVRFVLFFSFVCSRLRRVFFFSFDQVLPSADLLLLARMLEKKEEGAREIRKSFGFWCGTEMNLKKYWVKGKKTQ